MNTSRHTTAVNADSRHVCQFHFHPHDIRYMTSHMCICATMCCDVFSISYQHRLAKVFEILHPTTTPRVKYAKRKYVLYQVCCIVSRAFETSIIISDHRKPSSKFNATYPHVTQVFPGPNDHTTLISVYDYDLNIV